MDRMKRFSALLLVLVICFSLAACGSKCAIEDYCKKEGRLYYKASTYLAYYAEFEDGVLTIEKCEYIDNFMTGSGVICNKKTTSTYNYTVTSYSAIEIDGVDYAYTAVKGQPVTFARKLLDISAKWE